jgi:type IV secretory pathway VirB10-like protein
VSPRGIILVAGTVLVLGVAVYLFIEVRTSTAQTPAPTTGSTTKVATTPRPEPPTPVSTPPPTAPVRTALPEVPPPRPTPIMPTPAPDQPVREPSVPSVGRIGGIPEDMRANPKLDAIMAEANKAYDKGDFDEAKQIAAKVLAQNPTNVRMLRIMVSASCIDGDTPLAQKNYLLLPEADRAQMRTRCERYGVTFKDQ